MNNLVPVILAAAPELAHWLFGEDPAKVSSALAQASQSSVGTVEPGAVRTALQQNPEAASQLRVALGQLAADWERLMRSADLEQVGNFLVSASKNGPPPTGAAPGALAWAAAAISGGVLVVFTLMMTFIMLRGMPAGAETAVNLLLGTLAAMATSVVSYWVGSSAGSARKDDRLAQLNK